MFLGNIGRVRTCQIEGFVTQKTKVCYQACFCLSY